MEEHVRIRNRAVTPIKFGDPMTEGGGLAFFLLCLDYCRTTQDDESEWGGGNFRFY